jgi:hypothetical protein
MNSAFWPFCVFGALLAAVLPAILTYYFPIPEAAAHLVAAIVSCALILLYAVSQFVRHRHHAGLLSSVGDLTHLLAYCYLLIGAFLSVGVMMLMNHRVPAPRDITLALVLNLPTMVVGLLAMLCLKMIAMERERASPPTPSGPPSMNTAVNGQVTAGLTQVAEAQRQFAEHARLIAKDLITLQQQIQQLTASQKEAAASMRELTELVKGFKAVLRDFGQVLESDIRDHL